MTDRIKIPRGFRFAGLNAGVKVRRRDLGLVLCRDGARVAGVVTRNRARAACTDRVASKLPMSDARALIAVSGNANALTGPAGVEDDERLAASTAEILGLDATQVLTACTGVIGIPMPMERIEAGLRRLPDELNDEPTAFAESILTTDTSTKVAQARIMVDGEEVRLLAIAKGSGMIHPDMATMLCFVCTDLGAPADALQATLEGVVARTFNRISVDRDMSTNDMVLLLASGAATGPRDDVTGDAIPPSFEDALEQVCADLARKIARDGEGATRLLEVTVVGAPDEDVAASLARAVTESNLFKAALFSGDPNWGRALAALGSRAAGIDGLADPRACRLTLQGETVYDGAPSPDAEPVRLRHLMQANEIRLVLTLADGGPARATAWGCDLSYEYVRINADIAATLSEGEGGRLMRVNEVRRLSPRMRHELLVDCLDHIQRFRGLVAVVRVGGEVAARDDLREALVRDLLLLRSAGLRPVVVHGGNPELVRSLDRLGDDVRVREGVLDTRGEATRVVEGTLIGRINKDLVGLVQRLGGRAVGVSGKDGDLIRAQRLAGPDGESTAGVIEKIDPSLIGVLDEAGFIPIVAPIGLGPGGETVTLSANLVAAHLAVALDAQKLIFLCDAPGLVEGTTHITRLKAVEAERLIAAGSLKPVMVRRLEAALVALRGGVDRIHLVDARVPHHIVGELFTTSGVGTMISEA